jgi:hypothetical protein
VEHDIDPTPELLAEFRYHAAQMSLLLKQPHQADNFDWARPLEDQFVEHLAAIWRITKGHDDFTVIGVAPDSEVETRFTSYGRRLTYVRATTPPDERAMLDAVEALCVDVLIAASRTHQRRTGRYLAAAELRALMPSRTDIAHQKGGSLARFSTWVNQYMPIRQATARVQPAAAERAIAALTEAEQLDQSVA